MNKAFANSKTEQN